MKRSAETNQSLHAGICKGWHSGDKKRPDTHAPRDGYRVFQIEATKEALVP